MDEKKIKHLEFIQANITRMNSCSFQMKGWTITIDSALLALYAATINNTASGNVVFLLVGIAPTILFWFLDSYYLQQERKFRGIYNDVAGLTKKTSEKTINDFEMPLNKYNGGKYSLIKVMFSKTEWLLYLSLIIGLIIAGIILK